MGARPLYLLLALACSLFAVYGSLLPFDFRSLPLDEAWRQFLVAMRFMPRRISRGDTLANLLLFVPIGFSWAGALLADRRRGRNLVAAPFVVLPMALIVSLAAEFLQTFAPGRVPSLVDVASHVGGALCGLALWFLAGQTLTDWGRTTLASHGQDRLSRLLTAYAAAWVFVSLAPFDITVDLGELAERVRTGDINLRPFAGWRVSPGRRVWDGIAECLGAVPLGVLGTVGWNRLSMRSPAAGVGLGLALLVLVETAQVFIRSHAADVTDLLMGSAGVVAGVVIAARFLSHGVRPPVRHARFVVRWAAVLFAAWCVVLYAYHWLPYDFTVDTAAIRQKLARMSLIPFAGYGRTAHLNALKDLLTKLSLSVPLGVIAAFVVPRHRLSPRVLAPGWMALAALVFGSIELGQFFLPSRVPDPTDVLVGVAATVAGLGLGWWVQGGHSAQR